MVIEELEKKLLTEADFVQMIVLPKWWQGMVTYWLKIFGIFMVIGISMPILSRVTHLEVFSSVTLPSFILAIMFMLGYPMYRSLNKKKWN